jgi:multidrug resistance protein
VTTVSADSAPPSRSRLPVLFFTVLVDLIGFGIVLPLLPLYADGFGADGASIGLLVTIYAVAQFFMAPLWGRLSDRHGRKPILVLGLVGSSFAYVVFAFSHSFLWLFASRVLAGVGGSTIPVAEAYIADVSPPEKRAGNMGLIGAAFGLGFTIGPAIGGILGSISFEAPGLFAAGLCALNAVAAMVLLPETLPREQRASGGQTFRYTLAGLARAFRLPDLRKALVLYFLFTTAFAVIQPTLSLFGSARFGFDARQAGYLFAFLGLLSALMQGALVRRLVPRLGELRLIRMSGVPFVAGMLLISLSQSVPVLLTGLALLAIGYGGALPSLLGLISRVAPDDLRGGVLGVGQSVGSMARIVGPAAAGFAFDVGTGVPYLMGAGIAWVAGLGALTFLSVGRLDGSGIASGAGPEGLASGTRGGVAGGSAGP